MDSDKKGLFVPAWVIACVLAPFAAFIVGSALCLIVEMSLLKQRVGDLEDGSSKRMELVSDLYNSTDKRIQRIEDKVFGE